MTNQTGYYNELLSKTLVNSLIHTGVSHFAIAPGSRSTTLALVITEHPQAKSYVHYDERGLAFFALGLAKALQKPVGIVVTSGTAVGNLLPAVMEAYHSNTPLVLLTADRPPELRYTGANQTTDQVKLFGNFVHAFVDLPCPSPDVSPRFLSKIVADAIERALHRSGPIHINCMFKEPFLILNQEIPSSYSPIEISLTESCLKEYDLVKIASLLQRKRGLIIGGDHTHEPTHHILELSEKLAWPILPEICSPLRSHSSHSHVIPHYDLIAEHVQEIKPEVILHLGGHIVSRKMLHILENWKAASYIQVTTGFSFDPNHLVTHSIKVSPNIFAKQITPFIDKCDSSWLNTWKNASVLAKESLNSCYDQIPLSEALLSSLLDEKSAYFIGNSLPIREMNAHFFPKLNSSKIFTSRGLSGIDGCIATAIGIAEGMQQPLTAWIGDLAFLHDITSLSLLKNSSQPVQLLVTNNDGGGIFSLFPVKERSKHFKKAFATPHGSDLKQITLGFGVNYYCIKNKENLKDFLRSHFPSSESCVIEIKTSQETTAPIHSLISSSVKEKLCSHTQLLSV